MIRSVDHAGLTVPDLEEAIAFLSAAFGCQEVHRIGPFEAGDDWMARHLGVDRAARIPAVATLALGDGARLELFAYEVADQERIGPRNSDVGGHHVAFYADDLPVAIARAEAAGGIVMGEPTTMMEGPTAGETWVYVRAPWGGQFELITRRENADG